MNISYIGTLLVIAIVAIIKTYVNMNLQVLLLLIIGVISFIALVITGNQILNEDGEMIGQTDDIPPHVDGFGKVVIGDSPSK